MSFSSISSPSELTKSSKFFETLFQSATDSIIALDEQGKILICNNSTQKMFGFSQSELIGKPFSQLLAPPYGAEHETRMKAHLSTPDIESLRLGRRVQGAKSNKIIFPISVTISESSIDDNHFFLAVIRDITKILNTELELENRKNELTRANRELEMFAAVAAHDLQAPLRSIANLADSLKKAQYNLDSSFHEKLERLIGSTQRMKTLIDDLLTLARVGREDKNKITLNANDLCDQIVKDLSPVITETKALITRADLPTIRGSRVQLGQLFQNLLSNAIKFKSTEVTPQIHIDAFEDDSHWGFAIIDNGIGIEPQYFNRIFEAFERLHGKHTYQGTGIGLAICKKTVEQHDGKIWVESTPGQGSKFFFTIAKN